MKDLQKRQKIAGVIDNLADAKYEIYQAIETLEEMQSDDMAARLSDVRYELQQVLDMAYAMAARQIEENKRS